VTSAATAPSASEPSSPISMDFISPEVIRLSSSPSSCACSRRVPARTNGLCGDPLEVVETLGSAVHAVAVGDDAGQIGHEAPRMVRSPIQTCRRACLFHWCVASVLTTNHRARPQQAARRATPA
jgi:hypothetical protein